MRNNLLTRIYFLLMMLLAPGVIFAGDIVVITSPTTALDASSVKDVRNIYLGRIKSVGDVVLKPVDMADGSTARIQFLEQVVKKTPRQFKSHWIRLVFSGKASPMTKVSSEQEVIDWVLKNTDGIGYVSQSSVTSAIKVIFK